VNTNRLTDAAVRRAKPGAHAIRLFDGGGMYLEVAPSGGKWWRHKFRYGGKEKLLSLGIYPQISLSEARKRRQAARELLAKGIDPSAVRKAEKAAPANLIADSFEVVAREFLAVKIEEWSGPHSTRWLQRLEHDVFPWLGAQSLASITAPMLLQVLRRVEARGVRETVHSIQQSCGQVFRYGVSTGRCERNPATDLRGALRPVLVKHMAAVTEPKELGDLLRAIDEYQGSPVTRAALQISALVFQRPGNIRAMKWTDVELEGEAPIWTIPAAEMKRARYGKENGRPHLVPLAQQAVAILEDLHPLTGHGKYVFPSLHGEGRCMSENTVNVALRRLGVDKDTHTAHGFRSSARTLIVEKLGVPPEVIESQLAHAKPGLGNTYDRAEFVEQRRQMMDAWANYLDKLRKGGSVIPPRAAQ
jgi:integrase